MDGFLLYEFRLRYNFHMPNEFNPTEIIFAATTLCNLRCPHCFVNRSQTRLKTQDAKALIASCRKGRNSSIEKIGFSGGEPFLYMDFLKEIIKSSVENDFMFDQIMTNGVWWKTEEDLEQALNEVYKAGYDGKIGLSYDNFHGQDYEKVRVFCSAVNKVFGEGNLNIQAVSDSALDKKSSKRLEKELEGLCNDFEADIFILPQTFQSTDSRAWQSKKWFKEDYCTGPGNILFVHPDGNIAPCCGFANENPALFIGKITDSFDEIMEKARKNEMIKTCFSSGLLEKAKTMEKNNFIFPDKKRTDDICTFCDFICREKQK